MADDAISRLKKRRGNVRTSVTKLLKNIEAELKNETSSDSLEEYIALLEQYSVELDSIDTELQKIIDLSELDTDINAAMEYREKITIWKLRANKKLNSLQLTSTQKENTPKTTPSPNEITPDLSLKNSLESMFQEKIQINLPKLSIQKFYGEISQWLSFWNSFESAIHKNTSLDKISKFNYLKAYLGGTALQTVEGFAITPENYDNAIKMLEDRFGRKEILINTHMNRILNIPPLKNSNDTRSFRKLVDSILTEIRSLESLSVLSETYSAMLCPILLKTIPSDLVFEFNKEIKNSTYEIKELLDFLTRTLIARERSFLSTANTEFHKEKEYSSPNRRNEKQERRQQNYFFPPSQNRTYIEKQNRTSNTASDLLSIGERNKKTLLCIFCNKSHGSPDSCDYASNLTLEERKNILFKKGACFKCCCFSHLSRNCMNKNISCKICGKGHLSIMCYLNNKKEEKPQIETNKNDTSDHTVLTNNSCFEEVLLQTLIVCIKVNGLDYYVRAIFDSGSQKSYVSKFIAESLKLKCLGEEVVNHGLFGGIERKENHKLYSIRLSNIEKSFSLNVNVMDQEKICIPLPKFKNMNSVNEMKCSGIFLSDILMNENVCFYDKDPKEIHILLGADVASEILTGEIQHFSKGLIAVNTKLGWTVLGKVRNNDNEAKSHNVLLSLHVSSCDISALWSLDTIGIRDPGENMTRKELEDAARDHFQRTVRRKEDGRYIVSLPWIRDHPPLSDCRSVAKKRLDRCVKSLERSGRLSVYEKVFENWLEEDIIEEIENSCEKDKEHFLPHRPIFKENSTTKVRPVFDGSAKEKNHPSLNDCLEKGPNLIELIPSIVNKFRLGKFGLIADIEKAFLQIEIQENDRKFLKFLWWEHGLKEKLKCFQHKRVVFGITSSPFLLAAVIEFHLNNAPSHLQETACKLKNSFYVDNCVLSVKSAEECSRFILESQALMSTARFNLRGRECSDMTLESDKSFEKNKVVPVLGLNWNLPSDTLSIDTKCFLEVKCNPITKREVLSAVHRIYDPIGFTCPVTLAPKVILQECWKMGISWDTELPLEMKTKFEKWKSTVPLLKELAIPRYLLHNSSPNGQISMHVFCDASQLAYAACIFIRSESCTNTTCELVQARNRVAPIKKMSIPRLELLACTIGARLATTVKRDLGLDINIPTFYWSDSANALYWIKKNENWGVYVFNRVQEIRKLTNPAEWRHIAGPFNPADLPSRGCNGRDLIGSSWWKGPEWLKLPSTDWPQSDINPDLETINSEKRKTIVSATNSCEIEELKFITRISSYEKIVRILAWVLRFCTNLKEKRQRKRDNLTVEELEKSEKFLLKEVQKIFFDSETNINLRTFKDVNGITRVETRVASRRDLETFRYPMLLPNKHPIVEKLIMCKHLEFGHAGTQTLMSVLRESYWIIKTRKTVRQVIRKCVICKRYSAQPFQTISAPLPEDRVKEASIFEVVGVDLCGPLYLKKDQKSWVVIFTCAIYRAVHLELVTSLSTEYFILALRRFVARRGRPSVMYSDNGTNLVGTANELKALNWKEIEEFATTKRIKWKLNPPSAPWWGGFWERLIRILKNILKKVLGNAFLNQEEITTVLCDAESIINSRPLTYLSEDPEELISLSPSAFLQEIREIGVPDLDYIDSQKLNKRFIYKLKILQDLRLRFRNEYLGQLKDFYKTRKESSIKEGDIVLIGDTNTKKINWPLAKILKTYPGKDGIVRVVEVKTRSGKFLRPVQRLFPLEVSEPENLPLPDKDSTSPLSVRSESTEEVPSFQDSVSAENDQEDPLVQRSRHGRILRKTKKLNL